MATCYFSYGTTQCTRPVESSRYGIDYHNRIHERGYCRFHYDTWGFAYREEAEAELVTRSLCNATTASPKQ